MNFEDELETEREYGRKLGYDEGYKEGYDKGYKESYGEGKAAVYKKVLVKLVSSGAISAEAAAAALGLTADEVRDILEVAKGV